MRLSTITNWAYGATVLLTLASGTTMMLASGAQTQERAAVEQRYRLDQAAEATAKDIYRMSELARDYAVGGDQTNLIVFQRELRALRTVEYRLAQMRDIGAKPDEVASLREAIRLTDTLVDEQETAVAMRQRGDSMGAMKILFSPRYERDLDRIEALVERFEYRLDQRTENDVAEATRVAKLWRGFSEVMLGLTGLLFLCVLYFIFKRRVLRPVVRLSDVVARLAAQDYEAEPPEYGQIDEIGDMAQAIRVFRENGLERQRLEEERGADRHVRDMLSRMTQRMQGCDTLNDLENVVARFVPEIAPTMAGRLYMLDADRNVLVESCAWNGPVHSRNEFVPLGCWALRRGVMHRPIGEHIDIPCDHVDRQNVDSVCLPLTAQRETVGLLYLELLQDVDQPHEVPEVYLKMLAENIGLAIGNMRLRDMLRDMALADPLTGLANRRQLDAVLEAELGRCEREGTQISALMLDIDHFKRFNDDHGHDAGDTVLREVSGVLLHSMRGGAQAFRFGGEEFLMLMPGFDADQAIARAEEICDKIRLLKLRHDGVPLGNVTVSVGVSTSPRPCPSDRLVPAADAALYRAKRAGRNRVVSATDRNADQGKANAA